MIPRTSVYCFYMYTQIDCELTLKCRKLTACSVSWLTDDRMTPNTSQIRPT